MATVKRVRKVAKKPVQESVSVFVEESSSNGSIAEEGIDLKNQEKDRVIISEKDREKKKNAEKTRVMDVSKYKKYEQIEHVLNCSGMYIGSIDQVTRNEFVYDQEKNLITRQDITVPQGLERLFIEGITNASDNVGRSKRNKVNPGIIQIDMNENVISITNGGVSIPVEIHPEEGVYVPEMIFGSMMTSSNFDTEKHEAGANGLGVKLINVFSKKFEVEIVDSVSKLSYYQKWEKNMSIRHEPVIMSSKKSSYVKITFEAELERFGYEIYPKDAFDLFHRHCLDISLNSIVTVRFNEDIINCSNIVDYAKLLHGKDIENYIVHYEWPLDTQITRKKTGEEESKSEYVSPIARICVLDTPYSNEEFNVSFVNSMMTRDGGDHVNAVLKAVSTGVVDMINTASRQKSGKNTKALVNIKDVRSHISLVILFKTTNPGWSSQAKTSYVHTRGKPPIKFNFNEKTLKSMLNWKLVTCLNSIIDGKKSTILSMTDGKKKKNIGAFPGYDANDAGEEDPDISHKCVLLGVEGDSASGYAKYLIAALKAHDTMGYLKFKGKPLNVSKAKDDKIAKNKEIFFLKLVLGLEEGLDYSLDENFYKLRYGRFIFLTDADVDGDHIKALGLNVFFERFKGLLERGYVQWLSTPILRATKGKKVLKFYTLPQYEQWKETDEASGNWKTKYFKGLGTSTPDDVKDDAKDLHYITVLGDENTSDTMKMAFGKDSSDDRKRWILSYENLTYEDIPEELSVTTFINVDFIRYSIYNIERSIPTWDGLKPSQRKVLWASYLKWKWSIKKSEKPYPECKVAQFSGYVSEKTDYHHGEDNLHGTIINMAQSFVGSNNLPYFVPEGQFGSRDEGGHDHASPRYIFTMPQWWLPYVFRKEDFPIMEYNEGNGEIYEPLIFLSIIPMALVNGANGIGTGWSTFIPCCNIMDIIYWYKNKLSGDDETVKVKTWYRGFKGKIELASGGTAAGNSLITSDEEVIKDKKGTVMVTTGIYKTDKIVKKAKDKKKGNNLTTITELPIGLWTFKYKSWLDELVLEKTKVKNKTVKKLPSYTSQSGPEDVYFELTDFNNPNATTLHLKTTYSLNNMILLNDDHLPVRFESINNILEYFYEKRLPYYSTRKDTMTKSLQEDIVRMGEEIAFILAIVEKRLKIRNVPKDEVLRNMKELSLNEKFYAEAKMSNISKDEVENILAKRAEKAEYLERLTNTSPEQFWMDDLCEFENEYTKRYPDE